MLLINIVGYIGIIAYFVFYFKTRKLFLFNCDGTLNKFRLIDLVLFVPVVGEIVFFFALKYGTA